MNLTTVPTAAQRWMEGTMNRMRKDKIDNTRRCPFCGGALVMTTDIEGDGPVWYRAFCPSCFRAGPLSRTEEKAVEALFESWT